MGGKKIYIYIFCFNNTYIVYNDFFFCSKALKRKLFIHRTLSNQEVRLLVGSVYKLI